FWHRLGTGPIEGIGSIPFRFLWRKGRLINCLQSRRVGFRQGEATTIRADQERLRCELSQQDVRNISVQRDLLQYLRVPRYLLGVIDGHACKRYEQPQPGVQKVERKLGSLKGMDVR